MGQHTPLPWSVEDRRSAPLKNIRIVSSHGEVAQVHDVHQRDYQGGFSGSKDAHAAADVVDATGLANAAFIVRACNLHERLIKGLEHALGYVQYGDFRNGVEEYGKDEGQWRADQFADEILALIVEAKGGAA